MGGINPRGGALTPGGGGTKPGGGGINPRVCWGGGLTPPPRGVLLPKGGHTHINPLGAGGGGVNPWGATGGGR